MNLTQESITNALKTVKYPGYSRDIVSFGLLKSIAVNGRDVSVSFQLTGGGPPIAAQIKSEVEKVLLSLPEVERVHVEVASAQGAAAAPRGGQWDQRRAAPGRESSRDQRRRLGR